VDLRLYDSFTRQVRAFDPLVDGTVGIYVCGATPQSSPHIGHVRAQVSFDVLRRWLTANGQEVTYVRNVTDIDDKILIKSAEAHEEWWARAYRFEREFDDAYAALNVLAPTIEPRATGHVTDMIELIGTLIDRGHAYPAGDGSGDVYFDVRSYPPYGELTNQRIDDMEAAADADPNARKKDPRDFALWKGSKPGEPPTASWPTPWGRGRPGWHLECTAMATRYLGPEFDIHGGGLDLRFPHHENELAQARAAGPRFARYWLHNGLVVAAGEKMSKSLENGLTVAVLTRTVRPVVLRYLLAAPHYRSSIEVNEASMTEATAAFERIEGFVQRAIERVDDEGDATVPVPDDFAAAMNDDLGTPAAIAVLHDTVRRGNLALAAGDDDSVRHRLGQVRAMAAIIGIDPRDEHWQGGEGGDARAQGALDTLVRAELDARAAARKERDFAAADAIRARLAGAGVAVEDTPDGARWTLETTDGR
jgi:cysteinyl-tRNA synthetase